MPNVDLEDPHGDPSHCKFLFAEIVGTMPRATRKRILGVSFNLLAQIGVKLQLISEVVEEQAAEGLLPLN